MHRMQGIDVVGTDRGGKVTYHGPGQLVGYPIVRVDDVVEYVRTLERALVTALAEEGVEARARPEEGPDYTGVWVQGRAEDRLDRGPRIARGVTTHGFRSSTPENDLQPFAWVVPCGPTDLNVRDDVVASPRDRRRAGRADEVPTPARGISGRPGVGVAAEVGEPGSARGGHGRGCGGSRPRSPADPDQPDQRPGRAHALTLLTPTSLTRRRPRAHRGPSEDLAPGCCAAAVPAGERSPADRRLGFFSFA